MNNVQENIYNPFYHEVEDYGFVLTDYIFLRDELLRFLYGAVMSKTLPDEGVNSDVGRFLLCDFPIEPDDLETFLWIFSKDPTHRYHIEAEIYRDHDHIDVSSLKVTLRGYARASSGNLLRTTKLSEYRQSPLPKLIDDFNSCLPISSAAHSYDKIKDEVLVLLDNEDIWEGQIHAHACIQAVQNKYDLDDRQLWKFLAAFSADSSHLYDYDVEAEGFAFKQKNCDCFMIVNYTIIRKRNFAVLPDLVLKSVSA